MNVFIFYGLYAFGYYGYSAMCLFKGVAIPKPPITLSLWICFLFYILDVIFNSVKSIIINVFKSD